MPRKIYLRRDELEPIWHDNAARIHKATQESNLFFNLKFLDAKKHDITETMQCRNQVLVVYKNGRFEILPTTIHGQVIKDYLGVQFSRIKYWTVLPTPGHRLHPCKKCTGPRSAFDIYEH